MAITEYHQHAVDLFSPFNHEWCTYYLNSGLPKVTENDWANETSVEIEVQTGQIYFLEWTHELEDFYVIPAGAMVITGGETKASI
ncbi:MAG: hypothetical protein VYD08_01050, partial [Pseudomonadota bacterium]|nr:hypothetical protein [Pseudomonadota bacterium]